MLQKKIVRRFINLKVRLVNINFWLLLLTDTFLIVASYNISQYIRFIDNSLSSYHAEPYIQLLIVCIKIASFYAVGVYRGMWRYTSYTDIVNILKGTLLASVLSVATLAYIYHFQGFSRSIFIIDAMVTFLLISGNRASIRFWYQNTEKRRYRLRYDQRDIPKKKLLLVGAGSAAEKILRELRENQTLPYIPVGLVDDNPKKIASRIHGIPVVGLIDDMPEQAQRMEAQELLITIASASGPQMKRIVEICQSTQLPYKVLPGIGQLIRDNVSVNDMRDISYVDLLGRKEVLLDSALIGNYLESKVVLITGAGGTIGSELCRQVITFEPALLILFDAGEENLYNIQMELMHEYRFQHLVPILGKVQNKELLNRVFRCYKPAVVFHAAAYKHVPLIENNPWEAVVNNVLAAQYLIEASFVHLVERFVLVSTDKAVRPTNVMGASKRLTEMLMQAYSAPFCPVSNEENMHNEFVPHTVFMAVRFGNVLGSSGSVIPLFKRQIERGGPVTVTHPEINRFFMSIEEAAQLILQAGSMGQGGEIFLLKMGQPVKIADMARELIKLSGRVPDVEIAIKYTGLREGEKLYEELITDGEGIVETGHEEIMVLRGDEENYSFLFQGIERLTEKARQHDASGIKEIMQEIIPEYKPDYDATGVLNQRGLCPQPN
ncbi:MAG: nucleoside-diphosphate sugar epimerase/dehydratase [Candidatus Electrothrix aestuarii]|uniref:Nucleoside-diphosphate sugar epimerase/dehydratase n=1 Tax=Candidatus Electrothrix aestuarii TaxID=3062594 RepID=A0AAU8M1P6_9BACT|nr:nucleoside-diphosphate sugar epimerase/dehydratase [Candidatus Electrothrix aestuarii]